MPRTVPAVAGSLSHFFFGPGFFPRRVPSALSFRLSADVALLGVFLLGLRPRMSLPDEFDISAVRLHIQIDRLTEAEPPRSDERPCPTARKAVPSAPGLLPG